MKVELDTIAGIAKAIFLLIVGGFISRRFEKRAKLVSFFGHVSAFNHTLPGGAVINVYSHSVVIRNSGSGNATNVRIHHTTLPDFRVWPEVPHAVETLPNGSRDIVIASLIPKEQLTISYLYFPPLLYSQTNAGIKCDQGFAQQVIALPQPKPSRWMTSFIWGLIGIGTLSLLYLVYLFFSWACAHYS